MRTNIITPAYTFVMLICLVSFSPVNAQQKKELEYKHGGFGLLSKRYYLDDKKISKIKVADLLQRENKEAYDVFREARSQFIIGTLIVIPSAAVMTIGIFSYLFDGLGGEIFGSIEKQPVLLITGIIGTTGGIILGILANGNFKKAARIYNNSSSSTGKLHLDFGPTESGGVGLTLSF